MSVHTPQVPRYCPDERLPGVRDQVPLLLLPLADWVALGQLPGHPVLTSSSVKDCQRMQGLSLKAVGEQEANETLKWIPQLWMKRLSQWFTFWKLVRGVLVLTTLKR